MARRGCEMLLITLASPERYIRTPDADAFSSSASRLRSLAGVERRGAALISRRLSKNQEVMIRFDVNEGLIYSCRKL